MTPRHESLIELLSPYHDDQLAPRERRAVEEHLRDCDACRTRLADYRRLADVLRSELRVAPAPPVDAYERVCAAAIRPRPLPAMALRLAAVLVLALGVAAGIQQLRQPVSSTAAPPPLAGDPVNFVSAAPDQVIAVAPLTGSVVGSVTIGPGVGPVAMSPDGRRVYVGHDLGIRAVDSARRRVVASLGEGRPAALAISPDGTWLYAAMPASGRLVGVDTAGWQARTLAGGLTEPSTLAIGGDLIYIGQGDGSVVVAPRDGGAVSGRVALASDGPPRLAVASSGDVYAAAPGGGRGWQLGSNWREPVAFSLPVGPVSHLAVSPDGGDLYVTYADQPGRLVVIARATLREREPAHEHPRGLGPFVTLPDGRLVFVKPDDKALGIYDRVARRYTTVIPLGRVPIDIAGR